MILFEDDWRRDNAGIHYDTTNKTFLRTAMALKKLNVRNYSFLLALHQPDLAGYDPHNLTDPSRELRLRIAVECSINPWYFFREVARVPASGGGPAPFRANRASIAMIWCFLNNITYIAIQPRQTGKTITACLIVTFVMYVAGSNIEITLYTKDSALVQANVGRIKTIRDALPDYFVHRQIKDTDNKEGLSYERMLNRYRTAIAPKDRAAADNLARGMTSPFIHLDEPSYCTNIDISYPIMMLSTIAAVQNARARNQPHSNILTTTAAPIDTARGRFTYDLVNRAMPFTEKIYDLHTGDEARALVRANSKNNMINGTFSYLMMGYTKEWYEEACRISDASQEVNDRELLNIWRSGSETSILEPVTIRILNANKYEPEHTEIIHDYVVKWYVTRAFLESAVFRNGHYILGMDSSENIGQDFTTLVMIDVANMAVVCTFRCNESNTIKIGMFIAEFLVTYQNVTFIPERNSTGGAIIDVVTMVLIRNQINPFRRIFNMVVQNRNDPEMKRINVDDPDITDTAIKKHLGFRTSAKTRPFLYKNTLRKAAALNATRIYDTILIAELSTLATVNGRIDHADGGHDDTVIAYLLCCWLVFFGENLQYYGITVRQMLTSITIDGTTVDPVKYAQQLDLRRQIKRCQDLLGSTTSDVIKNTYRQRILLLQDQLDHSITVEPIGISKVNQDVLDYGKTHYTPQELAHEDREKRGGANTIRQLFNLF